MTLVLMLALSLALPAQTTPTGDAPVARFGDRVVTADEYGRWLIERMGITHIDTYLIEKMLVVEADAQGILPTPEEVDAKYDQEVARQIRNYYRGDRGAWVDYVRGNGDTPETFKARRLPELTAEMCLQRLAARKRTFDEESLRERYDLIYGDLEEQVSLEVLFFDMYAGMEGRRDRPPVEELEARAKSRAESVLEQIQAGTPMSELVEQADAIDSEFVQGTKVETWRKNLLGIEVEDAQSRLDRPGEIAPPVRVWNGYFLVRLTGRRPVTFEGERSSIDRILRSEPVGTEEMNEVRSELNEKYSPDILLR